MHGCLILSWCLLAATPAWITVCMCECKDEHMQSPSQSAKIPEDVDVWGPEGESSLAVIAHGTCFGGDGLHDEKQER